jgi:hypothetical protein
MNKTNKYYFQGTRFVPGYNDFDFDDITIEAQNEEEAWKLLDKHTRRFTWRKVGIVEINGKKVSN